MRWCCSGSPFEWGWDYATSLSRITTSRVITPPPVEPLTLEQVKLYRRIDNDIEDSLLTGLIVAAREYVQGYAGQSLVTQTREAKIFGAYVAGMPLPFGPVQSTEDPATDSATGITTVQYVAGYPPVDPDADPIDYVGNVPESFKTAMQLLIGEWYENREQTIVGAVSSQLELGVHALIGWYRERLGFA